MSAGHCTALNLSLIECLKLCIVHPSGTYCFNHLLSALRVTFWLYLVKINADAVPVRCQSIWVQGRLKLRDGLDHLVDNIVCRQL